MLTNEQINEMKCRFADILINTKRESADKVISNLQKLGFFEAPASTKFHLSYRGGLVEHSLNVYDTAINLRENIIKMKPETAQTLSIESIAVSALLHDVCKAEIYKIDFKKVKNDAGIWEKVPYYTTDYSFNPLGHGEKSVIRLIQWGFVLTADEIMAIRWHMSAWDLPFQSHELSGNLNAAREKCPLLTLLQCADMISSGIIETASFK